MNQMKRCRGCKQVRPLSVFYINTGKAYCRRSRCVECIKKREQAAAQGQK